jgi:hypothetical protein
MRQRQEKEQPQEQKATTELRQRFFFTASENYSKD